MPQRLPRFSREDWQTWRNQGWTARDIARHVGLSRSRVDQLARHYGRTAATDPLYRLTQPGLPRRFDAQTEADAYALGLLWGTAGFPDAQTLLIRHRDRALVTLLQDLLDVSGSITTGSTPSGLQTRLKISRTTIVRSLRQWLTDQGWTPRQAAVRPYPMGPLDDRAFIRAWMELHAVTDQARTGRRRQYRVRLRIYGNYALLTTMNNQISTGTGLALRTLQNTTNVSTRALYYTGQSAHTVLQWLYQDATVWHPAAQTRLWAPLIRKSPRTSKKNG